MSYFCGCHTPVMLLILCFIFLLRSPAVGEENRLFELPSRDEVVQIAAYGEEKLSTVLVGGSVNCEASFNTRALQSHAWPIPGVLVGVNCQSHATERNGKSMVAQGATDEFGDFIVDLPSHLHATPSFEKICRVKIQQIPKGPLCRPTHVKRQKGFRLLSFGNGIRT